MKKALILLLANLIVICIVYTVGMLLFDGVDTYVKRGKIIGHQEALNNARACTTAVDLLKYINCWADLERKDIKK